MTCLIEQILDGDQHTIVFFYKKYSPKIFRFLISRVKREDAKEILNEVFLDMIDEMSLIKNHNKILSYLYKIAHNKVVDFYRKRKIKTLLLSHLAFLEPIADEINQPDFQFEKNIIRDRIEITFHLLSQKYQKILRLHYEENISIKNMAPIFGLSYKATESLLFRARQSFKKTYERT